ncbi:hypothetical protein EDC01DRAFT_636263 [Geopyxis carbonaria]|nr:hypothetical protein EDC01DRAFT_636263 [Geopyxis carbonaria]
MAVPLDLPTDPLSPSHAALMQLITTSYYTHLIHAWRWHTRNTELIPPSAVSPPNTSTWPRAQFYAATENHLNWLESTCAQEVTDNWDLCLNLAWKVLAMLRYPDNEAAEEQVRRLWRYVEHPEEDVDPTPI